MNRYYKDAETLIEDAADLQRRVLLKHTAAVLEEIHDQLKARFVRLFYGDAMNQDLIIRLREQAARWRKTQATLSHHVMLPRIEDEAADEIERLAAELQRARQDLMVRETITGERLAVMRRCFIDNTLRTTPSAKGSDVGLMIDEAVDRIISARRSKPCDRGACEHCEPEYGCNRPNARHNRTSVSEVRVDGVVSREGDKNAHT